MERFLPMLAVQSQPFDSAEHLFEVKWDGVRAVAAVEAGQWKVWGRELADYTQRYPELDVLRRLPAGIVLDGELVLSKIVDNLALLVADGGYGCVREIESDGTMKSLVCS